MTRNLRRNLVIMAVEAIKSYAGPNASRETAAELLPRWQWLVPLGGEEPGLAAEILTHFELAEPVMVEGRDYTAPVDHYVLATTGDPFEPAVKCSCGKSFENGPAATAYDAYDAHIEAVESKRPAVGNPKVHLPLVAERFQAGAR